MTGKQNQNNPELEYSPVQLTQLVQQIKDWGKTLGFDQVEVADTQLELAENHLNDWLDKGFHGEMDWMQKHGSKRTRPAELESGTLSVITARMNYFPANAASAESILADNDKAYISRYALGRDYHKLLRKRLQQLADRINDSVKNLGYRVFVDSAPVMEKPLAENSGLGWIGKHSNLIDKDSGSWFFLGEIYTNLPLKPSSKAENHCGTCTACIESCPTRAIVEPYIVDARLCISYLTIEHASAIPEELRPLMGNRIYGCDDCQLCCPWNRFATASVEPDFSARHQLDDISLLELFKWDEATFLKKTEGSAIRRIGYERWLRNLAVALGNIPVLNKKEKSDYNYQEIIIELKNKLPLTTPLVQEHIEWALKQYLDDGE